MFKKTSSFLSLTLLVFTLTLALAGCSQEEMKSFKKGDPVSASYSQQLSQKADSLNTVLIDLNSEIENVITNGSKETDAYVQGLIKKREDLMKERRLLLDSLNQREQALKDAGKQLDTNLRHSIDSLTDSGMVLRNTVIVNPTSKTK